MKRSLLTCAVFLLALVAAVRVEAITVQEISVSPYQIANITVDGFWSGNVYAGINNLLVDGTPMTGFCIDPFHFSRDSSPGYDYVALEDAPKSGNGGSSMGADTANAISDLWAMYYSPSMSATNAAGLQIAIWMLVGGSKFHVTNDFGASALIASLSTYTGPGANLDWTHGTRPGLRGLPEPCSRWRSNCDASRNCPGRPGHRRTIPSSCRSSSARQRF